jgi:hypothetical protein
VELTIRWSKNTIPRELFFVARRDRSILNRIVAIYSESMQPTFVDSANLFRLVHFFDILAAIVFAVLVASRKGFDRRMQHGANPGLWFVGISRTRPASFASAYFFGSVLPTNQKTDGVCHAAPNTRKSSLADVGLASRTRSLPKCSGNASTTRRVASGSLVTRE